MAIRKARNSTGGADSVLGLVKAAAWAWHQHGSGNDDWKPPFRDRVTLPDHPPPRPTRFKLEAMRGAAESESSFSDSDLSSRSSSTRRSSTELLDRFEVDRISRQIQRLMAPESSDRDRAEGKEKAGAKRVNGFWIRHGIGVCRPVGDVIPSHVIGGRRRVKARAVV